MNKFVIKRNGEYHPFHAYKIEDAILKAFKGQQTPADEQLIELVFKKLEAKDVWAVEEIQDIIEKELFAKGYFDVMRAFMLHRHTRKLQREHLAGLNDDTTYIDCSQTIEEYAFQKDWRINANANTSYSSAGLINNVAGKVIANYWASGDGWRVVRLRISGKPSARWPISWAFCRVSGQGRKRSAHSIPTWPLMYSKTNSVLMRFSKRCAVLCTI